MSSEMSSNSLGRLRSMRAAARSSRRTMPIPQRKSAQERYGLPCGFSVAHRWAMSSSLTARGCRDSTTVFSSWPRSWLSPSQSAISYALRRFLMVPIRALARAAGASAAAFNSVRLCSTGSPACTSCAAVASFSLPSSPASASRGACSDKKYSCKSARSAISSGATSEPGGAAASALAEVNSGSSRGLRISCSNSAKLSPAAAAAREVAEGAAAPPPSRPARSAASSAASPTALTSSVTAEATSFTVPFTPSAVVSASVHESVDHCRPSAASLSPAAPAGACAACRLAPAMICPAPSRLTSAPMASRIACSSAAPIVPLLSRSHAEKAASRSACSWCSAANAASLVAAPPACCRSSTFVARSASASISVSAIVGRWGRHARGGCTGGRPPPPARASSAGAGASLSPPPRCGSSSLPLIADSAAHPAPGGSHHLKTPPS